MTKAVSVIVGGALLITAVASAAQAGGLERSGYDWDLLFSEEQFVTEAGVVYVTPNRKTKNIKDTDPRDGLGSNGTGGGKTSSRPAVSFAVPRFGMKVGITPDLDCLGSYSEPWGGHEKPGADWVGANSAIETSIESHDYGLTCSYKFSLGKGRLRAIGGVSYQELSGSKKSLSLSPNLFGQIDPKYIGFPGDGIGSLDVSGHGVGWRIGAAYEIPEIAFRASLIYNAAVDFGELKGTVDTSQVPTGGITDIYANVTMPQSVDFKIQTGIAPGWLAFAGVKWVDWSSLDVIAFCPTSAKSCNPYSPERATSLNLMFQDGWTVSAGIGHQFNEHLSGSVQVSWDRGTTTGLSALTDTWFLGGGVAYSPTKNIQLVVGGGVGLMTAGSAGETKCVGNQPCGTDISYDFGNDVVTALSVSGKVKF
jgi:long-chain fatty acid transport protein